MPDLERVMRLLDLPPTLTVAEAGELLGLSRSAAYRAADAGQLPTLRFGRKLRVPTPGLMALLGHGVEPQSGNDTRTTRSRPTPGPAGK